MKTITKGSNALSSNVDIFFTVLAFHSGWGSRKTVHYARNKFNQQNTKKETLTKLSRTRISDEIEHDQIYFKVSENTFNLPISIKWFVFEFDMYRIY